MWLLERNQSQYPGAVKRLQIVRKKPHEIRKWKLFWIIKASDLCLLVEAMLNPTGGGRGVNLLFLVYHVDNISSLRYIGGLTWFAMCQAVSFSSNTVWGRRERKQWTESLTRVCSCCRENTICTSLFEREGDEKSDQVAVSLFECLPADVCLCEVAGDRMKSWAH